MYLASLKINNFRRIKSATIEFEPGLNIIVGPNNIGKTAVVDALRSLLAGTDDPYPQFNVDDVHLPKGGAASGDIVFEYIFKDLSLDDEADFLHGLKFDSARKATALLRVTYGDADRSGRLPSAYLLVSVTADDDDCSPMRTFTHKRCPQAVLDTLRVDDIIKSRHDTARCEHFLDRPWNAFLKGA
jgi:hypothetical protein